MPTPLRWSALACHTLLATLLGVSVLAGGVTLARAALAAALLAPLAATTPGLAFGRRPVERWLAVLLVVYIGGTSVEVVAQAGAAPLLGAALLAAVLELGLLLALIRRPARRSPPTAPV